MKKYLSIVISIVMLFGLVGAGIIDSLRISPYKSNPELEHFSVTKDNGLKIQYRGYSVTYQPVFIMENGQQYKWSEIPATIQKDLWKIRVAGNKYKYGADFSNIPTNIKENLKFVVLHRTNATKIINGTEVPMTASDIQGRIKRQGSTIILNNKVYISHQDILRTYNIPIINKTDIVIGGLNNNWTVCDEWNETDCIESHIEFNWIDNGDGTWNITFDPTITIGEEEVILDSLLTNVTAESGDANFTHLNISNEVPYDDLVGYWNFDGDNENSKGNKSYDFSKYNNDGTMVADALVNFTNCIYGDCLQLDGDGDYIIGTTLTQITSPPYTMCAWFNTNVVTGETRQQIFLLQTDGSHWAGISTYNDDLRLKIRAGGGTVTATKANILSVSTWYHICGVYEADDNRTLYFNGDKVAESTTSVDYNPAGTYKIGIIDTSTYDFNGTIDEVMIFDTSLTTAQITDIYNNQSARFVRDGKQQLNNQSAYNFTAGDNRINVTADISNLFDSNISLALEYFDTSWHVTDSQNLTSGVNSTYEISDTTTNVTLNFTFYAGNLTDTFYTPILMGDIILGTYTSGELPPEDCWTEESYGIFIPEGCVYEINSGEVG